MHHLIAVVLICWASAGLAQLTHVQTLQMDHLHEKMRGVSGIELSDDGLQFTAVTDFADLLVGTITRDNDGMITDISAEWVDGLKARSGRNLRASEVDAEGLAISEDGRMYVAFERVKRVAYFPDPTGPAINIGSLEDLTYIRGNGGLEALAIHPDGRLFAIAEVPRDGKFPILQFANGQWVSKHTLPQSDGFHVVGADFDDQGRLFVLERRFRLPFFTSRVWMVDLENNTSTQLWRSQPGEFDNLEGIAVWYDTSGHTRVSLVSDDNDRWFQQTQLVEFILQDD